MSDHVQNLDQLEAVTGLHTLATIPHQAGTGKATSPESLITLRDPKSWGAESYRTLRNAVLLSSTGAPPKSLLFTSALPGEGRSLTAANFAIVLAQMGRRVLLLDADLQHPALHSAFGVPNTGGLGQALVGDAGSVSTVTPVKDLPALHLLAAGTNIAFPSEALGAERFRLLIEGWKQQYDSVVIDSAPLLSVSDSMPLAKWADAVILVTRSGATPLKALQRVRDLLDRAHARVAGVVLNDMEKSGDSFASSRKGKL